MHVATGRKRRNRRRAASRRGSIAARWPIGRERRDPIPAARIRAGRKAPQGTSAERQAQAVGASLSCRKNLSAWRLGTASVGAAWQEPFVPVHPDRVFARMSSGRAGSLAEKIRIAGVKVAAPPRSKIWVVKRKL